MRIVYLIHSLHGTGGMERGLSVKASWLSAQNNTEVYIITASLRGRKPHFFIDPRVNIIDLGTGDHFGFALNRYKKALNRTLCELKPDIVISLGGNDLLHLSEMKDGSVKISEFHFAHEKFLIKYGKNALGRVYAKLRIKMVERAAAKLDTFVVLTKEDRKVWEREVPGVRQIYNPITTPIVSRSPLTRKRMVAAGRFEPQKNYPDMIKAWKIVHGQYPDWTLDIYGTGSLQKIIRTLVADPQLEGSVRLMGLSPDIESEMQDCSGIVLSSNYEGFPLVLIEAASVGLPLLSYDCRRGPSEIVDDGVNGFLVKEGDYEALAASICKVIGNEDLRKSMGDASYERSHDFEIDAVMKQWKILFDELLKAK